MSWKKSFLVSCEIVGLFFNTLTREYKYCSRNMQNLAEQFQTQLSQKRKDFSGFFVAFLKCASGLEHYQKKDETSSLSIPEILDSKGSVYLNV